MNVLFLEDRGTTARDVIAWLKDVGHEVYEAFNPADAQSIWNRRVESPIHCIILDLSLPADGLTDEQKRESCGGVLCGWIWLRDNVLKESPEMRCRTIIHSDYIHIFRDKVREKSEYSGIALFPKRCRSGAAKDVTARVERIARLKSDGR